MLQKILDSGVKLTPMMGQYISIKEQHPETLLFFRMGDFYELFFEDAHLASKLLNITLTHRGKIGEFPIPMAGIPHHSAGTYVDRITSQGLKVAICEQVEDPKTATGIVKRQVTQVVSPGMPFDLERGDFSEYRYIASGVFRNNQFFLVLLDFTTGEFIGIKCDSENEFLEKLLLFSPRELVTHLGQWEKFPAIQKFLQELPILKTHLSEEYFQPEHGHLYIEKLIPSYKRDEVIKLNSGILCPIAAISYYICTTQIINEFFHIRPFRMEAQKGKLKVTLPTLRGLEILPKSKETFKESLLGYMDKTKTSMGTREIKYQFQTPLSSLKEITSKHQVIEYFLGHPDILKKLREDLSSIRDLERILAKISTAKVGAFDLINLAQGIFSYEAIIADLKNSPASAQLRLPAKKLAGLLQLSQKIQNTLNDEIGASLDKNNLIKKGFSKERDHLAQMSGHSADEILKLEEKYRRISKIPNLKIKYNHISGYFIEVSKSHLAKIPKNFERRQTLVSSERFVTKELQDFEKEVLAAQEKLERLERKIFEDLVKEVAEESGNVLLLSRDLGTLDVHQSFSWVALTEDFTRPQVSEGKKILRVQGAFHPLIKSHLKDEFVTHDLFLDHERFFGLITGPNMAGKTTVMREMAIIQFLTQIGSYVPARAAEVGLCDYLFSRLGASDDILKGQSTFMVEMSETAEILRHATEKSLIIMDEVGRGTSTFDGLSIAWALVEHFIQKVKALTLFSTHYHELIDVVKNSQQGKNLTVETVVNNGEVRFLYRLIEGETAQSYGIFVAKLAGLPQGVLSRAQNLLQNLEEAPHSLAPTTTQSPVSSKALPSDSSSAKKFQEIQLCFFPTEDHSESLGKKSTHKDSKELKIPDYLRGLETDLLKMDVMNMTPLQALEKLHKLQKQIPLQ